MPLFLKRISGVVCLAHAAHSPDLARFQGDSGRDSQQGGPRGETGDIGPMVGCSVFLGALS